MRKVPRKIYTRKFKLEYCTAIRAGIIGRREAERKYDISPNLTHNWLAQFERGDLNTDKNPARAVEEANAAHIAELERIIGRLTIENERLRTAGRPIASNDNEDSQGTAPCRQGDPTTA